MPKLIVILGPTASGKTGLSLKLAKKFGGEIVNADSRQVYKKMDIGTGKVENKKGVRHYLLDVVNPDEEFTLAGYKKKAVAAIDHILKRGKTPFLVGGTGLYIQAIVDNLTIPSVPPNKKLRTEFEHELAKAKELGIKKYELRVLEKWFKKLLKLDPCVKDVVDAKNPRRIIRALEICLATGRPFSKMRGKGEPLFHALQLGITMPREKLYKNIDDRVDEMIKDGLIEETKKLLKKYNPNIPSMSGIGYKEIGDYLGGSYDLDEAAEKIKFRTHAYARRQMTWFRRGKRIKWIKNYKEAERKIGKWLNG